MTHTVIDFLKVPHDPVYMEILQLFNRQHLL